MPEYKNKEINNKGFSIYEVLVTVAIIAIMSTMAMVNFRSAGKKTELDMAAQKLASDIRKLQSYALNSKQVSDSTYGWGIYIKKQGNWGSEYFFYADGDKYNSNGHGEYNNGEKFGANIILPDGISISSVTKNGDNNVNQEININYFPPDPTICFQENGNDCEDEISNIKDITIILSNGSIAKKVKVNIFGLVDID